MRFGARTRRSPWALISIATAIASVPACTSLLGDDFEITQAAGGGTATGGSTTTSTGGSGAGGSAGAAGSGAGGGAPAEGTHLWSERFGDDAEQQLWNVVVDDSGQIVIAGNFSGTFAIGGSTLNAYGERDLLVAKLAPDGNPLWAKQFGGSGATAHGIDVMVTPAGEPIVIGDFAGQIDFGGGPLYTSAADDVDPFVLKLTANGAFAWARAFSAPLWQSGVAIAPGPGAQIVVGGNFVDSIDLGGGPMSSPAAEAFFVGVLDATGNHVASWSFGSVANQQLYSLAVSSTGTIYATGTFNYLLDFAGPTLNSAGGQDIFLGRIDPATGPTWSIGFGGANDDGGAQLALSPAGDVLGFAGWVASSVDFGAGAVPFGGGVWDGVVAAFNTDNGAALWSKSTSGANTEGVSSVSFGPDGQLYTSGIFVGTLDLGGGPLESGAGVIDFFLAELDADGSHVFTRRFGGSANQFAFPPWPQVAATPDGHVVLAGWFFGSVDFGGGPLDAMAAGDLFVAKYY
jgi:hypothetical protein